MLHWYLGTLLHYHINDARTGRGREEVAAGVGWSKGLGLLFQDPKYIH
jgi:hypothetical protein